MSGPNSGQGYYLVMAFCAKFTPVRPSVYGRMALSAGFIELAVFDADIVAVGRENLKYLGYTSSEVHAHIESVLDFNRWSIEGLITDLADDRNRSCLGSNLVELS